MLITIAEGNRKIIIDLDNPPRGDPEPPMWKKVLDSLIEYFKKICGLLF